MNKENACNSAGRNDVPEASKDISLEGSAWRDKMVCGNVNVAVEAILTDGICHGAAKNVTPTLMNTPPRSVILLKMKRKRLEKNKEEGVVKKRPNLGDSGNQASTKCGFEKAVEAVLQSDTTTISNHAIVPASQAAGISRKDQDESKEKKTSSITCVDDNLKDSSAFDPRLEERLMHDGNENAAPSGDGLSAYFQNHPAGKVNERNGSLHSCTNNDEAIETLTETTRAKKPIDPIVPSHAKGCPPEKPAGSDPPQPAGVTQFPHQKGPPSSMLIPPPSTTGGHFNNPNPACYPPNLNHGMSPQFFIPPYNPYDLGLCATSRSGPSRHNCPPAHFCPSPGYFPSPPPLQNGFFPTGMPPPVNNGQHQSSTGHTPPPLSFGHPPWLGGNMAMSNGHGYASPQEPQSLLKLLTNMKPNCSMTAAQESGWQQLRRQLHGYASPQEPLSLLKLLTNMKPNPFMTAAQESGWQQLRRQLVASQYRLLDSSTRGQQPSKTHKAAATEKDSRPSSQEAHAVSDSGSDAPSGEMPKIPACRQHGNEANQETVFVDAVEHEDEIHPVKRMVPPADPVGGASDTTRRDDDPKPTQEYIHQDQPTEKQDYIFAHAMESDEAEPHPVMEPQKPRKDREPVIVGGTGAEEDRRPAEYQTLQDDGNAAPANTTSDIDMNRRQEAAVEAPQGSGASEEPQKLLQEAIATEKAYTLERDDGPDIPHPICEAEVATLEPPQKRVRLSNPTVQPGEHDVLCCSRSEKQYGNYVFHSLVEMSALAYQQCTDDLQKMGVAKYIFLALTEENGRFLNQTSDNEWYVVSQTGAIRFALRSLQRQCDRLEEVARQSRRHGPTLFQDSPYVNKYTPIELLDDGDDSLGGTEEGTEPNEGSPNTVEKSRYVLPKAAGANASAVVSQKAQGSRKDDTRPAGDTRPPVFSLWDRKSFNGSAAHNVRSTLEHGQIDNGLDTRVPLLSPISKVDVRTARAADRTTPHPRSVMPEERESSRGLESAKRWKVVSREHALRVLQQNPTFPFHGIITPRPMPGMNTAVWINKAEVAQWMQRNKG